MIDNEDLILDLIREINIVDLEKAEEMVDRFLDANPELSLEVREYIICILEECARNKRVR